MGENKTRRSARPGRKRKPARSREIDGGKRPRNQYRRPRPQRVLHRPQGVASPRGFNEQQRRRIKTERGKTWAVEIAGFARER